MSQAKRSAEEIMEDYALQPAPDFMRNSWASHFAMLGIPLCMYYLAIGSLGTAFAGFWPMMASTLIAWGIFIIFTEVFGLYSWREGYSFDMLLRVLGWGRLGSFIPSLIAVWLFLCFWAMETHWMAVAIQKAYNINILWYYAILFPLFVFIPLLGHRAIAFWNYIANPVAVLATIYVLIRFYVIEGDSIAQTLAFASKPAIPGGFGASLDWSLFALGLWASTAGNFGRFCKTRFAAAAIGPGQGFLAHVLVPFVGVLLVFPIITRLTPVIGQQAAFQTAYLPSVPYVMVAGWVGVLIVLTWQLHVQYINAYLPSVSLANFFAAVFKWAPGRKWWVFLVNVLGLILLLAGKLEGIVASSSYAAAALGSVVTVSVADYAFRSWRGLPLKYDEALIYSYNPISIITFVISFVLGIVGWKLHWVPSASVITLPVSFVLYLALSYATNARFESSRSASSSA